MLFRRLAALLVPLAVSVTLAFPAAAQSLNLRDLLTDFLRTGITLAPPLMGMSHEAHFIGADSPQLLAVQQFNVELGNQLSSFPLASTAGGFTYRFDPTLGVFTRSAESFGPVYAERTDTIGKGRFNMGLNYSHFSYDTINGLGLRSGDLRLVFTHDDTNNDGSNQTPFFEGDVITARLSMKIETNITAFVIWYGVTDRFDVGAAIPIVNVSVEAQTDATIQRLATGTGSTVHRFLNGGTVETFRQSGRASGTGDIVLRGKYRVVGETQGGLAVAADVRLPTGDEQDLLGTGSTQVTGFLIGSIHLGPFSPHLNAGYQWSSNASGGRKISDQIVFTGGFDWAMNPRLTLAVDVLGRTFRKVPVVSVVDQTFTANTQNDPTKPPNIVTASYPRLVVAPGNPTSVLGSVGLKINPFGNFLLTVNGLFSLNKSGLTDSFTPLVAVDYSF